MLILMTRFFVELRDTKKLCHFQAAMDSQNSCAGVIFCLRLQTAKKKVTNFRAHTGTNTVAKVQGRPKSGLIFSTEKRPQPVCFWIFHSISSVAAVTVFWALVPARFLPATLWSENARPPGDQF